MAEDWLWAPVGDLMMVVISAVVIYIAVIVATRVTGLRSFAQFTSFDFAMSIAIGSLISITLLTDDPPLSQAIVGLGAIYALHKLVAIVRNRSFLARYIDNTPTILISDGEILHDNLHKTAVSEKDLRSILRRENVCSLDDVHAVILETAGHVSVIHSRQTDLTIDPWLLEDVFDAKRLPDD